MSYDFTGAAGTEILFDTPSGATLTPTEPNSFSAWIQYDVWGTSGIISALSDATSAGCLIYTAGTSGNRLLYMFWSGTSSYRQLGTVEDDMPAASATNWVHVAGSMDGTTTTGNWKLYINGAESLGSQSGSASTLKAADDDYYLGTYGYADSALNGRIAFPCMWSNYELTQQDVDTLQNAHPYTVQPGKIVFAPELTTGAVDSISQATGTPTNATLDSRNPPIVYPVGPIYIPSAAAAPPAGGWATGGLARSGGLAGRGGLAGIGGGLAG